MVDPKRVPWSQMEEYLDVHKMTIVAFLDLQKLNVMKIPDIEIILPNSFTQLHQIITKILKENKILSAEEEAKVD
jgi:hypothetical protein